MKQLSDFEYLLPRNKFTLHHDYVRNYWSVSRNTIADAVHGVPDRQILYYAFLNQIEYTPTIVFTPGLVDALFAVKQELNLSNIEEYAERLKNIHESFSR